MNIQLRILLVFFLTFFLSASSVFGCLQPVGESFIGQKIEIEDVSAPDFIKNLITHKNRVYWEKLRDDIIKEQKDHPFIDNSNNLAVALVHLGQIAEAIKILEDLEKKRPGLYSTAANLGTAYELNGENQKALNWIKEGIKRNEKSHLGTEWLHVKILEAKIVMEKEPNWLENHSVLGIDFSADETLKQQNLWKDNLGQQRSPAEVEEALIYQLHERLEFVKPPESVVADLLTDLSNVFALRRTPEYANAIKDLSISYGGSPTVRNSTLIINKAQNNAGKFTFFYIALGTIILLAIFFIYFFAGTKKSSTTASPRSD
jgi:tetratricopeptide (TPR) repeat protein